MDIKLEILQYSYWEHFKVAKDLALILPPEHPKRISLQKEIDIMLAEINNLQQINKNNHGNNNAGS